MFKKMYNLTFNEILKQYKKKAVIIISILILLSAIGVPFVVKSLTNKANSLLQFSYGFDLGGINSQIAAQDKKTQEGKMKISMLESQKQVDQLLSDNNIMFNDWRTAYSRKYLQVLLQIDAIGFIKQGVNPQVVVSQFSNGEPTKLEAISKGNLDTELADLESQKTKMESNIKNDNYLGYLKETIDSQKQTIDTANKELKTLEAAQKKNPEDKIIQGNIQNSKNIIEQQNNILSVNEYRYDNKIAYNNKEWKSSTLTALSESYSMQKQMLTEREYMSEPHKVSYERYKAKYQENQTNQNNQIKLDWYSLKNNIAQSQYQNGPRDAINSFVGIYVMIVTIFIIIIAGGIISSEFSKNTIKLLMIRPVSRFKIMLSKLLTPLIIGYIILFASIIILTITSGIVFGFSGLGIQTLKISGGEVVAQNYILSLILKTLFYSISLIFSTCLAFMISTVTRSTAVSVALSIVLFIGSLPVTLILLRKNMFWVAASPIPYISLPSVDFIKALGSMIGSQVVLNTTTGAIELLVLAVVFAVISFVYFIKKDIKL